MKILHIIPSLRKGGAERICLDICAQLGNSPGNQVELVILHNIIEYHVPPTLRVEVIPAAVRLSISGKSNFNTAALQNYITSFAPDVIHSHLFEAEIVSRSITYTQAKYFTHCHDNMRQFRPLSPNILFNKQLLTEYYERRFLLNRYRINGGNTFIAISKNNAEYFERVLPADLRNVKLLNNAVNTARFTRPANYKTNKPAPVVLCTVGSLVDNKNQGFLVEVIKKLHSIGCNAHLHILGDGPNRQKLVEKITAYGLSNHITLHGNVMNVEEYLWNSDIYVHAAKSEGFGLVMVEAMAAGLPVISLDAGGNRDIIENGRNGYILTHEDIDGFAKQVATVSNNKQLYAELSRAAVASAAFYDIQKYTSRLLQLYNS